MIIKPWSIQALLPLDLECSLTVLATFIDYIVWTAWAQTAAVCSTCTSLSAYYPLNYLPPPVWNSQGMTLHSSSLQDIHSTRLGLAFRPFFLSFLQTPSCSAQSCLCRAAPAPPGHLWLSMSPEPTFWSLKHPRWSRAPTPNQTNCHTLCVHESPFRKPRL